MGSLRDFLIDVGRNAYGLGENVASLGSAAIAEPVAGYAAMFDPVNGAAAIREGMTYQPRSEAGKMYQRGAAQAIGQAVKPVMPVVDTWQRGVDIAGRYSPTLGALLKTTPTALGVALGAKPSLQAGRQVSNTLGAMQQRMIANANATRTLNTGYMGQRGSIGTQRPLTEFEQAHLIAQRNAALPVSQGGLGLAPDNTAMDRARALGFEDGWAHGSPNPKITEMKPSSTGAEGPGTYATNYLPEASTYSFLNEGSTVYPLMVNRSKTLNANGNVYDLLRANSDDELLMNLEKAGKDSITANQSKTPQWLLDAGAPYMPDRMHYVSVKPYNFRSRFAAFDPMKKESSNLLATSAAIAPTATMAAYLYNQERNKGGKQ